MKNLSGILQSQRNYVPIKPKELIFSNRIKLFKIIKNRSRLIKGKIVILFYPVKTSRLLTNSTFNRFRRGNKLCI